MGYAGMTGWARVPPTVAPVSPRALVRGLLACVRAPRGTTSLTSQLRGLFPRSGAVPYRLGRAALAEALGMARRATGRDRVVLPAFTSFSVAAAAAAAQVTVDLCDLDPATLSLDRASLRALVDGRTAAVVLGNLFGYPDRSDDLDWLGEAGAVLIDDAAQALGATEGERPVGGRGDLGILSFGRGKCVSTGEGGALLIHTAELRALLRAPVGTAGRGVGAWIVAASLGVSTSPSVFGALSRLPGVRVGESWYEPDFDPGPAPRSVEGLGGDLGAAVARHTAVRRGVSAMWRERLSAVPGLTFVHEQPGAHPAYLRFPVLAPDARRREAMVEDLARAGFQYVRSFPSPLGAIEAFRPLCGSRAPTPNADTIAARLIALPCHVGIRERHVRRAVAALTRPS